MVLCNTRYLLLDIYLYKKLLGNSFNHQNHQSKMETNNFKNTAALTHLSALTQYFIPLGNYIFPIVLWNSYKEKSEFVSYHGKQVLNFQLSLLLYSLILLFISVPILIFQVFSIIPFSAFINNNEIIIDHLNIEGSIGLITIAIVSLLTLGLLKAVEFFLIIYGSIKASNGEYYKYPLTINFFK